MSQDAFEDFSAAVPPERPGPPDGKRARNRQRRLQQLQEAALPLFIADGIGRVTIDEIVRAAGVAKGSFYRYYPDKQTLVAAIFTPLAGALTDALDRCERELEAAETWDQIVLAYQTLGLGLAPVVMSHQPQLLLYLQENKAPSVGARSPVRQLADDLSRRAIAMTHVARRHGLLRDIPPVVSALTVVGAVERLTFEYLIGGLISDPLAAAQGLVVTILDGLRQTNGVA